MADGTRVRFGGADEIVHPPTGAPAQVPPSGMDLLRRFPISDILAPSAKLAIPLELVPPEGERVRGTLKVGSTAVAGVVACGLVAELRKLHALPAIFGDAASRGVLVAKENDGACTLQARGAVERLAQVRSVIVVQDLKEPPKSCGSYHGVFDPRGTEVMMDMKSVMVTSVDGSTGRVTSERRVAGRISCPDSASLGWGERLPGLRDEKKILEVVAQMSRAAGGP